MDRLAQDIKTAIDLMDRAIYQVTQIGQLPDPSVIRQINSLVPGKEYSFICVHECAGVGELCVNAQYFNQVIFCTDGDIWVQDKDGMDTNVTYDEMIPDGHDLVFDFLETQIGGSLTGYVMEQLGYSPMPVVEEEEEEAYIEMPAEAEAMMAEAAPIFERDGLPGQFVKSRTPQDKHQHGQHQSAYQVMGQGRSRSCTCPAARHGRKCWHLEAVNLSDAWEKAARDLYDVLSRRGTASPEVKARAIARTWSHILDNTPRTVRSAKLDVCEAMRRFIAFSSECVTRIHYNKDAANRELTF